MRTEDLWENLGVKMGGQTPTGILAVGEIPKRAGRMSVARDRMLPRAPDPDTSLALVLLQRPEVGTPAGGSLSVESEGKVVGYWAAHVPVLPSAQELVPTSVSIF